MVVAVMLTVTVSALAATGAPATGSLTVTGDKEFNGKTVDAYQVFTANWADSNETDTNDDNIDSGDTVSYVLNSAWNDFFSNINAIRIDNSDKTLSEKAAGYITGLNNDAQMIQLAKDMKAFAAANNIPPTATSAASALVANSDPAVYSTTISGLTPGYYLVIPESGSTSATRGTDATLVNVPSAASASWAIKSSYPGVEKTVDGNNKETTAQIGDIIPFTLTSAVPDMTEYTAYTLKFHDTFSPGLTYQYTDDNDPGTTDDVKSGVTITIDGDTVAPSKYNVAFNPTTRVLDIEFINFKAEFGSKKGAPIVITYSAMLNESAAIAGNGNLNTANVEYSNDPSDSTKTNSSTDSETKVYTYEINIDKYSDDATPVQLPGAVFQLKDSSDAVIDLVLVTQGAASAASVYRLATSDDAAASKVDSVTTPASGLVKIKGLEAGTYTLVETAAPTGYNKLASPITIVIAPKTTGSAPDIVTDYTTPTYSINGDTASENSKINVVNSKGSILPTTGGIGTIGLTIAGVAIVILGIIFTSRRKKSKE